MIRYGVLALWTLVILSVVVIFALALSREPDSAASAHPSIVIGTPGGVAVDIDTSTPQATPTSPPPTTPTPPTATPRPTPEPTAAATPAQATVAPAATPTVTPAPPPSVAPTPAVVAVSDPTDAVAAFYGYASSGQFDAAYSLWSERMRAAYPRQENLDERFDQTASVDFQDLSVAEQTADRATVQANFTETYDSGSSRVFVGYWQLVLVDGVWLLDEPHY
jgi:hypothetical protein